MTSTSFNNRPTTLTNDEYTKCLYWAVRMDQHVTAKAELPMDDVPPCYDIYRRYNPVAIDPLRAKALQQQAREIQNLKEIRTLQGGVSAPAAPDVITHRTLELIVDALKDFNNSAERSHRATLDSAIKAIRSTGAPYLRAKQRDNRRELHAEQREPSFARGLHSSHRDGAIHRQVRFNPPERLVDVIDRNSRRSASPPRRRSLPRIVRPMPTRAARRTDTPHPRGARPPEDRSLPLDYEYEGDQEMEDAFIVSPAVPPPGAPLPAAPPPTPAHGVELHKVPQNPSDDIVTPRAPTISFAAPGADITPLASHPFEPSLNLPIPPFPRLPILDAHHNPVPLPAHIFQIQLAREITDPISDTASTSDIGLEGASIAPYKGEKQAVLRFNVELLHDHSVHYHEGCLEQRHDGRNWRAMKAAGELKDGTLHKSHMGSGMRS
ncbi:hypothetical protein AURDEDRAFT_127931 [Auricularia subglabra TFB-10046 SS5]|nr:hypothetical protein AURDEDRAFT_127931 [Auricularia subglabra TFB-10046 SS5]